MTIRAKVDSWPCLAQSNIELRKLSAWIPPWNPFPSSYIRVDDSSKQDYCRWYLQRQVAELHSLKSSFRWGYQPKPILGTIKFWAANIISMDSSMKSIPPALSLEFQLRRNEITFYVQCSTWVDNLLSDNMMFAVRHHHSHLSQKWYEFSYWVSSFNTKRSQKIAPKSPW